MLSRINAARKTLTTLFILVLSISFFLTMQSRSKAQEECCQGNLLKNGNFSTFTIAGTSNFPPSTVASWLPAFQTPQIVSSPLWPGCDGKPGFISMWGNKVVGEGIRQTNIPIQAGHTYKVTACVKVDVTNTTLPKYVRFNVRASNGPLTSYTASGPTTPTIGIIGDASNTPISTPQGIVSTVWTSVTLQNWTAPASFDTITINLENDSTANDGNTVSWGHIDNVCIQEVRRDPGDGSTNADPHITTLDGIHYDFQSAGEFVILRDGSGLEIQTRQTPVCTSYTPGANPYTGLGTCVSLNTAVAVRVGNHRVSFQPNLSGVPDPSGLQLRVDGALTTLGTGLALTGGGHLGPSAGGGLQVEFLDGTTLVVTPGWWPAQSKWYLNLSVRHTLATDGIIGRISPGGWLPALPNGSSLGPKPTSLHQRYLDLYQTFADAWRVTNSNSLFDYATGTSTATFTDRTWPAENGACLVASTPPVKPIEPKLAIQLCREVVEKDRADCVFDVTVTGDPGFAKTYILSQQGRPGNPRALENPAVIQQVGPTVTPRVAPRP
jgi:hypothetical protein